MKTTLLFQIILCVAFIISFILILIKPNKEVTKTPGKLELINKMVDSNKNNDGFCIENSERPTINIKEENSLYLTDHINSVINNK